jgi:hypothetical protein
MIDYEDKTGRRRREPQEAMCEGDWIFFNSATLPRWEIVDGLDRSPVRDMEVWTKEHRNRCNIYSGYGWACSCGIDKPAPRPEESTPLESVIHDLYTREVQALVYLQDMRRCNDAVIDLGILTGEELEGYKLLVDAISGTHNALVARVNYRKQLMERMAQDGRSRKEPEGQHSPVSDVEDAGENVGDGGEGPARSPAPA